MKSIIINFLASSILLTLFFLPSCRSDNKTQDIGEMPTKNASSSSSTYLTIQPSDSPRLERALQILELGLIDLLDNSNLKNELYSNVVTENYDDKYLLSALRAKLFTNNNINLISLMEASVLNHGGNQAMADSITILIDSFTISSGNVYKPFINVPFSDLTNQQNKPLFGRGWVRNTKTSLEVTDYYTTPAASMSIGSGSEQTAKDRPIWLISVQGDDPTDNEEPTIWLPWRRCYCTRGSQVDLPDGSSGTSAKGICAAHKNEEHCAQCGRAEFSGDCPGNSCPGC